MLSEFPVSSETHEEYFRFTKYSNKCKFLRNQIPQNGMCIFKQSSSKTINVIRDLNGQGIFCKTFFAVKTFLLVFVNIL